jgi:hypothetical protein
MSSIRTMVVATTVVITTSLGLAAPAAARCSKGFLADVACQVGLISKKQANQADRIHKGLGNPLDKAARKMLR